MARRSGELIGGGHPGPAFGVRRSIGLDLADDVQPDVPAPLLDQTGINRADLAVAEVAALEFDRRNNAKGVQLKNASSAVIRS